MFRGESSAGKLSQSSISRIITRLSDGSPKTKNRTEVIGLKLVTQWDDPQDNRHAILAVTPRGKELAALMAHNARRFLKD